MRLVFQLATSGDGTTGRLGVRSIAEHLNTSGYRTRRGNEFYSSTIHEMLTREAYTGTRPWNTFDKNGIQKADDQIVEYAVPQIIAPEVFDAVQLLLAERQPSIRGPRLDAAPSLFGGLIRCGCCGKAMTPSSGTSQNGERYGYYRCARAINKGAAACQLGKPVRRVETEQRVMAAVVAWLATPDRIAGILTALQARQAGRQTSVHRRVSELQQEAAEAEKALSNLYRGIESGVLDAAELSLQNRFRDLRGRRDLSKAALERLQASLATQPVFDSAVIKEFVAALSERLTNGPIEARKAWLGSIVDAIIVEPKKIRVVGKNDNFEKTLRNHAAGRGVVRSSVREWWAGPKCMKRLRPTT